MGAFLRCFFRGKLVLLNTDLSEAGMEERADGPTSYYDLLPDTRLARILKSAMSDKVNAR